MKLSCYLLSFLRRHPVDCEHCNPTDTRGREIRNRLEELNGRTQPDPLFNGDHEEVVEVLDSKPDEVISAPISLKTQKRKRIA